jgi:hypothetical protein
VEVGQWQGATGELGGGAQGGRRARRSGVELTRAAAQRGGGGGCFRGGVQQLRYSQRS